VFDVDRTLLPGISSEQLFLPYLLRRRKLGPRSVAYTLWFALRAPRETWRQGKAVNKAYLHRRQIEEVKALARACFDELIRPRISQTGVARAHWHHDQGHLVALLTGSPDFLISPLEEIVGADYVIAARMQERRGRYHGRMADLYPRGRNKAELMKRFAAAHDIDLSQSYGYADHHTDAPLLALFGHPVAVNPDSGLRRIARENDWKIEKF
jgi:HAD superfamily hydrolase (TIGR01490 family)